MKKIVLLIGLIAGSCIAHAQSPIREKASILKIDEIQEERGIEKLWEYFNEHELGFVLENSDYMYAISYEPKNEGASVYGTRRAFLYYRKKNDIGNWKLANPNAVFTHAYTRTSRLSYDRNRWYSDISPGISAVEMVATENGTCVAMFIGVYHKYLSNIMSFTHLAYFYPGGVRTDGSIQFDFTGRVFRYNHKFDRFRYSGREGNIFYGNDDPNTPQIDYRYKFLLDYKHDYENNDGRLMPVIKRPDK